MQKQDLATGQIRSFKRAPIPEALLGSQRSLHARKGRFNAERHQNFVRHERGLCGLAGTDGVFPKPVEILPLLANELRTRVFRKHIIWRDILSPPRHQMAGHGFVLSGRALAQQQECKQGKTDHGEGAAHYWRCIVYGDSFQDRSDSVCEIGVLGVLGILDRCLKAHCTHSAPAVDTLENHEGPAEQ